MERKFYLILLLSFFSAMGIKAQMLVDSDTLVGNEWITYGQKYYKFTVDADGIYRIPFSTLQEAGLASTPGSEFRIYTYGQQIPLYVSTTEVFGPNDFIEFLGKRNRGELDRFLFRVPNKDMLHPDHSMYTDKRPYYLTVSGTDAPSRVEILVNDIGIAPPVQPYYFHKEVLDFTAVNNDPYYPISGGGAVSYSSYLHGEGFSKASETNSFTNLNTSGRIPGTQATLHIRMTSANSGDHAFLAYWNGELLDTLFASGIMIIDAYFDLPVEKILDANQLNINNSNSISRHSLVTIELTYPRHADLGGVSKATLETKNLPGDLYYVLENFAHQNVQPLVYSLEGSKRMVAELNGENNVHFNWPAAASTDALSIQDQGTSIHFISTMNEMSFQDFTADDTEYIVITHPDLMALGTGSEYIQYRLSSEGGQYKAYAYSILDLYEQFGYGVERHPMAIRNFVEFMHRHWPSARMIYIIGRGLEYNRSRYENGTWENQFFVPTFGRPGGDNLLAATPWDLVPRYPIGRLAITNPEAIATYLAKVKAHDQSRYAAQTPEAKDWIKNVMHLGGGKDASEQTNFEYALGLLDTVITQSAYGGNVHFFQKKSTEEIGETQSAQVLDLLHEGCGLISYLGHSATSTFEYQINDPSEWNNKDRYPIFSAMGCSAGQIHGTALSLSDNYVRIPDEGAIAFISGSGSQFPSALYTWSKPWYEYFGNLEYGCTLGESILFGLQALDDFINIDISNNNAYRYLLEQQTLQGDPALQLHPLPGPDYIIDRNSILISPENLNTNLDSFIIQFSIHNIGRNLHQTVPYLIQMKLNDGSVVELARDSIVAGAYASVIHKQVPLLTEGKSGVFRLLITVDPSQSVSELPAPDAENNNQLKDNLGIEGVTIYVVDDLVTAAYPPDFSIVTKTKPTLTAMGSNAFSSGQRVAFELDTTPFFNSPLKVHHVMENEFSTYEWTPDLSLSPDQVYYWRVSADSLSPAQRFRWSKRSFIYEPADFPGWNQSEFYQLTDNKLIQLITDTLRRGFLFDQSSYNFNILNRFHDIAQALIPKVTIDGVIKAEFFTGFRNRNVQAFVVAIDSVTGKFMLNPNPGLYGSANHLSFDAPCFPYRMDLPESRQALIDFVDNVIPSGYYVFFYTYQQPAYPDYFPEQWEGDEAVYGKSIFSMIEKQYPSSDVRMLASTDSKPYIVFFQKDRGGILELIARDSADVVSMNLDIMRSLTHGTYRSQLAGPASQWYSIEHSTVTSTPDTVGRNIVSAIALSADLSDTLFISTQLTAADTSIAAIDAALFPYIQLTYSTEDSITYTPGKINYWRVLYEGLPEFIIKPSEGLTFYADTLNQGETMSLHTFVENLSPYTIDSLPVSLQIISEDNISIELSSVITDVQPFSISPVEFSQNTAGFQGDYRLIMEVNPGQTIRELNVNNNTGLLSMHVRRDQANPLLDVTFDGYHIKDGDLVSARPLINVRLSDENNQLRLTDTTLFTLYLEYPSDLNPRRVYFSYPWVGFIPSGTDGPNVAEVRLSPDLYEDGTYRFIVNAKDASGNAAGDADYMVSFEVINDAAISYIYNFPNPFSSNTRFIYTLTGPGAPADYSIEIYSVTGIKVRDITKEELGPLAPGHHMTSYAWDGSNQTGAQLSSGLYLYRLVARDESGQSFPHYSPYGQGTYSGQEWGKLMIVR